MTLINTQQSGVMSALRDAAKSSAEAVAKTDADTNAPVQGRATQDTVSLSGTGQKIVNLNRAAELGAEIKDEPVDGNFADKLKQSTDDVFRINRLFRQTLRAVFNWWRG